MLKSKTFLGVDFGAGSLKAAEFEAADDGGLRLRAFGVKALGLAGSQDAQREVLQNKIKEQEAALAIAKKQLLEQEGIRLLNEVFYQSVLDRLKPFKDRVAEAEKALAQTRSELNNLK